MTPELIPAILARTDRDALARLEAVRDADWVQIDCLDGHFVNNRSFYEPRAWPTSGPAIELHLMCAQPEAVLATWEKHPRFKRAVWQAEIPTDHRALIDWCEARGIAPGIALAPGTPFGQVAPFADRLEMLLLLSVQPGWSGQRFIAGTAEKVAALRRRAPSLRIGVDGGLDETTIGPVVQAGAERLYVGSRIFEHPSEPPAAALQHLRTLVQSLPL